MVSTNYIEIGEGDPGKGGTWDASGVVSRAGGCTERFTVTVATANTALQAAHDALPATGGKIRCFGGSVWTLDDPVNITKPNVTIEFNWLEMRTGATETRGFFITARNFCAVQPYVNSTNVTVDHSFFLFNDNGTDYATNGGKVLDGIFRMAPNTDTTQQIHAIRVIGNHASRLTRDFTIRGNTFIGVKTATQQDTPEDGSGVPYGFTPIRLKYVSCSDICSNTWTGECIATETPDASRMGSAMYLENCLLIPIIGNKFAEYTTRAVDDAKGSMIYVDNVSGNEGHHNAIVGNVEELANVDYKLKLKNPNHQIVVGNNIGRSPNSLAGIYTSSGQDLLVAANNIHNSATSAVIINAGTQNMNFNGNSLALVAVGVPPLTVSDPGTVPVDENNMVVHQIQ